MLSQYANFPLRKHHRTIHRPITLDLTFLWDLLVEIAAASIPAMSSPIPHRPQHPLVTEWLQVLHDAIERLSAGGVRENEERGMTFIGNGPLILAEEFLAVHDRKYQMMLLPSQPGLVDIFLVGDPKSIHERIAALLASVFFHAAGRCAPDFDIHEHVAYAASPTRLVNVRQEGSIQRRLFQPGTAVKEPDGFFCRDWDEALGTAIEVAYSHEDSAELWLEGLLWSQQGCSNNAPVKAATNFLGIDVEMGPTARRQHDLPGAFAIVRLDAADTTGSGQAHVQLINASISFASRWRAIVEAHPAVQVDDDKDEDVITIPAAWLARAIPSDVHIDHITIPISKLHQILTRSQVSDAATADVMAA